MGVGCLAFTLAGLWLVVAAPQGTSSRVWSALAALIAIVQGVAFAIGLIDAALEGTRRAAIPPLVFLALVLWLDVGIVLEARRRLAARPRA